MIIQNFDSLATTPLRKQGLLIAESGFMAVQTKPAVRNAVKFDGQKNILYIQGREYNLDAVERLIVVGFGKVAFEAVSELYDILGSRIQCGFVLDLTGGSKDSLTCTIGSHPFPTLVNVEATKQIVSVLEGLTAKDLLLCVVSGGGSSLLCYPYNMSCEQQTKIVEALMRQGATIQELNTVRKHISNVKGGRLAKAAYPAHIVNLVFSDVPGDDASMVASGPTLLDTTTVHDARKVLDKYKVLEICKMPSCDLSESPKDSKYFDRVSTHMLVSGNIALTAMAEKAQDLGFKPRIYKVGFSGEARELAKEFARAVKGGECLLASGESTVTVKVPGKGGRNLEMALAASLELSSEQLFIAFDSDGHDNTDFAGALVDDTTLASAAKLGLNPEIEQRGNSSYIFFESLGDYLRTGLTGSNVADLVISIKK